MSRVNDESLNAICAYAERCVARGDATTFQLIALDCRDFRIAFADTQTALAAKDARIAELEKDYSWSQASIRELEGACANQTARADRLEAQLQAARAAGTREEGLRESAEIAEAERHRLEKHGTCGAWDEGMKDMTVRLQKAIRARLIPAEPTADKGEKG